MPLYVFDKVEIADSVALPDALATVCAMFSRDVVSYVSSSDFPETFAYAEGRERNPLLLMDILFVLESNSYVP